MPKVEKLEKNRALAQLVKRHQRPPHELAIAAVWPPVSMLCLYLAQRRVESLQSSLRAVTYCDGFTGLGDAYLKVSFAATPVRWQRLLRASYRPTFTIVTECRTFQRG